MKTESYREWLIAQNYDQGTINAQLYRTQRVEESYGDLDTAFRDGTIVNILKDLDYSTSDERSGKPNPSKIPFNGDIRNNLASYRNALNRYIKFLTSDDVDKYFLEQSEAETINQNIKEAISNKLSLEKDLQAAIRSDIEQIEPGLSIIDGGSEMSVESGFIDITAKDKNGNIVVIELKASIARKDAIGQILSYMGDMASKEEKAVRGIIIAEEFDSKIKSAAKVVPNITLLKYKFRFTFHDGLL